MSELVAVGYSESEKATLAFDAIGHLEKDWISVNDVVVVARDRKGKLRLAQDRSFISVSAIPWHALWRRLLHASTAPSDRAFGSGSWPASAAGIPERFVRRVTEMVDRGDSALIIWARTPVPPRVHEYLYASVGDVLWAPLHPAQDALLASMLDVLGPVETEKI